LDADAVFRAGSVTTLNSDLRLAGTTYIEDGAEFNGNQHLRLQTGAILFSDATVDVDLFNEGGVVNPGSSAGVLTIDGDYTQLAGILNIELGGASAGQFDVLSVTGSAKLGDTLAISLIDGYVPEAGVSFDVIDWGSLTRTFDVLQLPALPGSLNWDTSQLYITGALAVVAPLLAGDYNDDGKVDAADYVVWRKNEGTMNVLPNDPDGGTIGAAQFNTWRANFGNMAGSGSGSVLGPSSPPSVPEPTTFVLFCCCAAGGWRLLMR
jgi:hypothetical protein